MIELNPACPFCGSLAEIRKMWFAATWRYYPICSGCGIRPQKKRKDPMLGFGQWQPHFDTELEAMEVWESRIS